MNFKFRHTDKIVGLYVFIALIALILSFSAIMIKQKLFVKKYVFHTRFIDAIGLSNSTIVSFRGFEIGKITKFTLNRNNYIDADFIIYDKYMDKMLEFSAISKAINPVTSKSSLEFLQGPNPGKRLKEGSFVPSLDTPEGKMLLFSGKVKKSGDVVSSILSSVDTMLLNMTQDNNPDKGAIFRMLFNLANATGNMNTSLIELNSLMASLQKDHNPEDGAMFRAIDNLADLTEDFKQTNAKVQQLLTSSTQLTDAYKDPNGLALKLVDPTGENFIEPMHESIMKINTSLSEINKILVYLNSQTPVFSSILIQGDQTLRTSQKTLEGINNNPLMRGGISKDKPLAPNTQQIRPTDVK
jgi:phospholipid/cholesterol/gamma-HCH transport system substrate-binding protein